jgi:hypothetical protein
LGRLFAGGEYIAQLWLFWLAPVIGAVIAGLLTRWMYEQEAITHTDRGREQAGSYLRAAPSKSAFFASSAVSLRDRLYSPVT